MSVLHGTLIYMNEMSEYTNYIKPEWAPPGWLFGPVWTVLYIIIAITFITVAVKVWKKEWPVSVLWPYILNLFFNFAFTPLQFGLNNNLLASADIVLVLLTLIWTMYVVWPRARWITYALIPYLLWVSFATVLQITITSLNF